MGKGSRPRPLSVSRKEFSKNFERIFGRHDPIALCKKGSDEVVAYACGKCGVVAASVLTHGEAALQEAVEHCGPWFCDKCGSEKRSRFNCWHCIDVGVKEREREQMDKAVDVTTTYDGPVHDGDDAFWSSPDAASDDIDGPTWMYACDELRLSLDASRILEMALEGEHHEDAYEHIVGEKELQEFLDSWCAKQTLVTWISDTSRKVYVIPSSWEPVLGEDGEDDG
jgi:hypothetical protein